MDEVIKINFVRSMLVLKIRDTYKAPYHKNKYLNIKKKDCEGLIVFKRFMHQFTGNWSAGSYDIQFVIREAEYMRAPIYYTFCRIDIRDGKVVKVWKNSPYTRKTYPIWEIFDEYKKKKPKKKVVKKKPKKKLVKKKIVKKKITKKK
ncbi:hypothetical protein K8R33_00960 [archaeon]|nr:hypothetical protein [archaeon]